MTALPPAAQRLLELPTAAFLEAIAPWSALEVDDAMWMRCREDRALFCSVMFPERFPVAFNRMHDDFLSRSKPCWKDRKRVTKEADAAPRGGAKSTLRSYAELLHDAVYGIEAYVAVISTTYDLAEDLVKDLHQAFKSPETYPDFHRVYGPFEVEGTATDFVVHVPGQDPLGTRFKAFSFGGTIRGTKHKGIRPTKVVMDDAEHPDRVRSPAQRLKVWSFLTKDILKAGARYTLYQVVGTVLHADSMLANLLKAPAWSSHKFKSIIQWPERMDLWQIARELWSDLTDPDRLDTARAFYTANKQAMDAGALVLWEAWEPLWDLMVQWWAGAAAFLSEKQNEARDPDRQVYDPDTFARCTFDGVTITSAEGRRVKVRDCTMAVWLDPRASEEIERNDYAAIAVVAKDPVGYVYVLYVDMQRDGSDAQRKRMWGWFERFPRARYGYENNGFQALIGKSFSRERNERKAKGLPWTMSPKGHRSKENKNDRMISLEPDVLNRWVQFAVSLPQEALEQFRDIPSGTHDDAPDAVERAIWLVRGGDMPSIGDLR